MKTGANEETRPSDWNNSHRNPLDFLRIVPSDAGRFQGLKQGATHAKQVYTGGPVTCSGDPETPKTCTHVCGMHVCMYALNNKITTSS